MSRSASADRPSVRSALTRYFLLATALPIVVSGILVIFIATQHTERARSLNHELAIRLVADGINQALTAPQTIMKHVFSSFEDDHFHATSQDLDQVVTDYDIFETLFLADAEGRVVAVGFPPELRHLRQTYLGIDLHQNPFFAIGSTGGEFRWSDTFPSFISGDTVITLSLSNEHWHLVGIIHADFIDRTSLSIDTGQNIITLITDSRGIVFSSSTSTHPLNSLNLSTAKPVADIIGGANASNGTISMFGERYFLSARSVDQSGWIVALMQDWNSVHRAERELLNVVLAVFTGALIASLLVTAYASRTIIAPIRTIIAKARAVSGGVDGDTPPVLANYSEIVELDAAFDVMLSQVEEREIHLKSMNQQLEERVEEETVKRIRNEQLLFEQQKFADMGRMLNAIAHQWRQPLNALSIYQEFLEDFFEEEPPSDERARQVPEKSIALIDHMSTTVRDFLGFFKPRPIDASFSVVGAVLSTANLVRAQITDQGITLSIAISDGSTTTPLDMDASAEDHANHTLITGSESEFSQVIMNLINNARDELASFDSTNPRIDVTVIEAEDGITVEVADTGRGISIDVMDRMFEPYVTTKSSGAGTGIGLYMSRMIIEERFNGRLDAENGDVGAIFRIHIPTSGNGGQTA